jgi:1-acyl-sn-glycerol-3-phosphate acyltransferase
MRALFSIYVWIVWALHLLILGPLAILLVAVARDKVGFNFVKWGTRSAFFFAGLKVVGRNADKVDWSRPYVLMANHQNLLDPFAMLLTVGHHVAGVEKRENLQIPVYGWLSRAWGNIPIQREDQAHARAGISEATERLRQGRSIAILPEGTRTKDGNIGPFKKGGFHMAIDAGAVILPMTINGSYQVLRNGDWKVYPGTIEIAYGEPIPTADYSKDDMDALMARVRAAIEANFTPQLPPA